MVHRINEQSPPRHLASGHTEPPQRDPRVQKPFPSWGFPVPFRRAPPHSPGCPQSLPALPAASETWIRDSTS